MLLPKPWPTVFPPFPNPWITGFEPELNVGASELLAAVEKPAGAGVAFPNPWFPKLEGPGLDC